MSDTPDESFDRFLDRIAERTPTPGGGGVTAAAGALACAMARMVGAYSIRKTTPPADRERFEKVAQKFRRADRMMRELIAEDAVAYTIMTQAAKEAKRDPEARAEYQTAVMAAITVPMEVAAIASGALAIMDEVKDTVNEYLISDLGVAAVLADATARAARYSVRINVSELTEPGDRSETLTRIDQIVAHSRQHLESIEAFVAGQLPIT